MTAALEEQRDRWAEPLRLLGTTDKRAIDTLEDAAKELQFSLGDAAVRLGGEAGIANDLAEIEDKADDLARLIDRYNIRAFHTLGSRFFAVDFSTNMNMVDRYQIPAIEGVLQLLSREAGRVRGALVKDFGSGDPDKPDVGGSRDLSAKVLGSPRDRFLHEIASLWIWGEKADLPAARFIDFARACWSVAAPDATDRGLDDAARSAFRGECGRVALQLALRRRVAAYDKSAVNLEQMGSQNEAALVRRRAERIRSNWRFS